MVPGEIPVGVSNRLRGSLVVCLAASLCVSVSAPRAHAAEPWLGGYPLCEASAALKMECPGSKGGHCLLVGDNEVSDRLFLFTIDGDRLTDRREIPIDIRRKKQASDIEALAGPLGGDILVYGSHSRNSGCEVKPKRQRTLRGQLKPKDFEAELETSSEDDALTCKRLFDVSRRDARGHVKRFCDALHAAEEAADAAAKKRGKAADEACNIAHDFNLEGAVAFGQDDDQALWVGLRAPTVNGKAVLLRQKSKKRFRFDAVVLVDLGGAGIRELAGDDDHVWLISGPANDGDDRHGLWHLAKSELSPDHVDSNDLTVAADRLADDLPTSSEGLAVTDGLAFVLIDGGEAKDDSLTCARDSTYRVYSVADF